LTASPPPDRGPPVGLLVGLALFAAAVTAFGPACGNGFVNFDDPLYVTENRHVLRGLSGDGLAWALTSTEAANWHPLTWLSLELDASISRMLGGRPFEGPAGWFHLTSVLLHAANAVLLFAVLARITGQVWPAALAAALFALHPLRAESVAWVSERKDVLSTFFGLLALAAYLRYARRQALVRYLLVVLPFALGLAAKPMLVTLPGVLLLLDYWPLGRLRLGGGAAPGHAGAAPVSRRLVLAEKVPLLALSAASCVVTLLAQQHGGAVEPLDKFPPGVRLANALVAYVRYLGMLFWPADLAAYYPHPGDALPTWQVAGAACLLVGLTAVALWQAGRRPYLAVGWLWYLGTLLPVVGLVQVGDQALADRYTYMPLIGPSIGLAWGAAEVAARWPGLRPALAAAAAAALLACVGATWRQVAVWHDSRSLWQHALDTTADNTKARNNLGLAILEEKGDPREAERHLRQAIRLSPDAWQPYANLGAALDRQKRLKEAIACYRRALELNPGHMVAWNNLAIDLGEQGKLDEAVARLSEAVRLFPNSATTCHNLARALLHRGERLDEALGYCRRALRLDPGNRRYQETFARLLRLRAREERTGEGEKGR
jgi:tetratricopeptide (TPR) repeat protein